MGQIKRTMITVGGEGDYHTVAEAVEAVRYDDEATIRIAEGVFREKLFIEKRNITLIGAGMGRTVIEYGDGADDRMSDGTRRGTFRSQTVFLGGGECRVYDMTIRNTAGPGSVAGQALAVYADASVIRMENVEISSYQDTLFLAPLPLQEKHPGGFFGPRMLSPREPTRQYYKHCRILGDVDFIFGGADALFEECEIIVRDRGQEINGYVTAPGDMPGETGFVFMRCVIRGETPDMKESVFLGRPWRPAGKAVFIGCRYDDCIHPRRFSGWGGVDEPRTDALFAEYDPMDMHGNPVEI